MIDKDGPSRARDAARSKSTAIGGTRRTHRRPRVLLGIRDVGFHEEVLDFVGRDARVDVSAAVTDPHRILLLMKEGSYDVVVLCPAMARDVRLRRGDVAHRRGALLVVAEEMTVPVLREAIEAAASGVFAWPEERDDLVQAVAELPPPPREASSRRGRVIAVYGARGGADCTFVATHLVAAFARSGMKAVLVDLDIDFCDVTAGIGIRTGNGTRTVTDLVPVMDELSPAHVEDALFRHPGGFSVLLAPRDGARDEGRYRRLYAASVALLAAGYDAVVLHVPRGLDGVARIGIELADEVVMVAGSDPLALHGAKRALSSFVLRELRGRCRIVVTTAAKTRTTPADIERVLGVRPYATVRFDAKAKAAQQRGDLLSGRSRGAGKDVNGLAALLASELALGERRQERRS